MSYISDIFERTNIQQVREFLLYGVECCNVTEKNYEQRLMEAEKNVEEIIRMKFRHDKEYEQAMAPIFDYAGELQDVYMEVRMQCGFMLAVNMLENIPKRFGR